MLLFQSTVSEELICELVHTGLTGDNKLKPLISWWISVNLLLQSCILSVVIRISEKKGRAARSREVLCEQHRQVLHGSADLLLAALVVLYPAGVLRKSWAARGAGGAGVVSGSGWSAVAAFESGLFHINFNNKLC